MLLPLLASSRTISPSGPITVRTYVAGRFDRLSVNGVMELVLAQGETAVKVETYKDVQPLVHVVWSGTKLSISLEDGVNFDKDARIRVFVSVPSLRSLDVSGVCGVSTSAPFGGGADNLKLGVYGSSKLKGDFSAASFDVEVYGTSKFIANLTASDDVSIEVGGVSSARSHVMCASLDLKLAGVSNAELSGNCAARLRVNCSGTSKALCRELACSSLQADINGVSVGEFTCRGKVDADASPTSKIVVKRLDGTAVAGK